MNFLSTDELEYFDDVIAEPNKYGYAWKDGSLVAKNDPTIKSIQERLYDLFKVTNGYVDTGWMIQKAAVGEGLIYHYDAYSPKGADIPSTTYGVAIYLNDNFTGGELHYKFTDVKIRPVRGMLAAHPGTKEYTHGVLDVTLGNRYAITAFIHNLD
jgi:hypothetical protein